MRAQELYEAPPQIVGPTDFDLSDDNANRAFAQRLLRRKKETLEDHPEFEIFLTGDLINGYIALYLKDSGILGYVIKYHAEKRALLGSTVTQVTLWRRSMTPHVPGITRRVFFDYLLGRWPMLMSDAKQTPDGAKFWGDRLAEASTGPYEIGRVDFGRGFVEWWDHAMPFDDWIKQTPGWGSHRAFQNLRYLIKRRCGQRNRGRRITR